MLATAIAPAGTRPQRLVHWFDFDERDDGNYESMPRYWFAIGRDPQVADPAFLRQPIHENLVQRQEFPRFTDVRFDSKHTTSGTHAFYLGVNGGSAGAFLQNGAVPVVPDSDYLITAQVRTEKLRRAGVHLITYFIDNYGQRIVASENCSPTINTNGQWDSISVRLKGEYPSAKYIGIQIELRQPGADPAAMLGNHQITLQDINAHAWFDDIAIWQLPHVAVATQSSINVIRQPQRPRLTLNVREFSGQRLFAELVIYDHAMNPVARQHRQVGDGEPNSWGWTPPLPGLGWYQVDMQVFTDSSRSGLPVSRALGAMLWTSDDRYSSGDADACFALAAEGLSSDRLMLLPSLLAATGLKTAVISAWSRDSTLSDLSARQDYLDEVIFQIRSSGGAVVISLDPIPNELAKAQDFYAWPTLAMLRNDSQTWAPYLTPILMRHGQRIRHWQLGSVQQPFAFFDNNLPQVVTQIDHQVRNLVPQPNLILPWCITQSRPLGMNEADPVIYAIDVPPTMAPKHLPEYLRPWQTIHNDSSTPARTWLYLRVPPADRVAHTRRATDMVLRMLHAWEAGTEALVLDRPWTGAAERRMAILPDPILGVFSSTAHRLTGRRVIGRMPTEDGVTCMILSDSQPARRTQLATDPFGTGEHLDQKEADRGMLVLWNDNATRQQVPLTLYLGQQPITIDIWGNRTKLKMRDGKHRLIIGPTPIFVEGIDTELAQFRASFKVQPHFIESKHQPHTRILWLTNPWTRTLTGQMEIVGPTGWQSRPARNYLSIGPGQTIKLPVTLRFPITEVAGQKKFAAHFQFGAQQQYAVDLTAPIQLGLHNVDFEANMALEAAGSDSSDVIVVTLITNTGAEPKSLFVFATMPEKARQEIPVSRLEPGQTVLRTFRFQDAEKAIKHSVIRAGVRQTNGPDMLTIKLTLDDGQ